MSLLNDLTATITARISDASPTLRLTSDATTIRPSLNAGQSVCWIGAPERIDLHTHDQAEAAYEVLLISPEAANHPDGLDNLTTHALALEHALNIESLTPSIYQPSNSPAFPALTITFTIEFTH